VENFTIALAGGACTYQGTLKGQAPVIEKKIIQFSHLPTHVRIYMKKANFKPNGHVFII
jgi:hypothetical protein